MVLCLVGGAHVQEMALIQVEGHLPPRGLFSNGCEEGPFANIFSKLRHLAEKAEFQVMDKDDDAHGVNLPHESFVKDSSKPLWMSEKNFIHDPRTAILIKHVMVKVEEVCYTRHSFTKTVSTRVNDVVCFKEIDRPVLDDRFKWQMSAYLKSKVT